MIEYIGESYLAEVASLHPLPSDSGKSLYQANLADGTRWILRVGASQERANFDELAQLLMFFEQASYPAERIVSTAEQVPFVTVSERQETVGSPIIIPCAVPR